MAGAKIKVKNDGPLLVQGEFTLTDDGGKEFGLGGRPVIALCRCGLSQQKPFCDGAHGKEGFASACPATNLQPKG